MIATRRTLLLGAAASAVAPALPAIPRIPAPLPVPQIPVGTLAFFADHVPPGWLVAHGWRVSRSAFRDLAAIIDPDGDGELFPLPDLRMAGLTIPGWPRVVPAIKYGLGRDER